MTPVNFAIDTDALHAFADGQLSEEQRAAVESYLATHPDAAAEVATWRLQNEALTTLFAPVAGEPVPQRLSAPSHRPAASRPTARTVSAISRRPWCWCCSAAAWAGSVATISPRRRQRVIT